MRKMVYFLIFGLLAACAPGALPTSVEAPAVGQAEQQLSYPRLRSELAALPGALVSATEPLRVSFPVGTLFAAGSVLPMPGGTGLLDALARVVKESNLIWQMKLRAATGEGQEYDQSLAAERVRILKTYLEGSGVNRRYLQFTAVAEEGAPLEMLALQPVPTVNKGVTK